MRGKKDERTKRLEALAAINDEAADRLVAMFESGISLPEVHQKGLAISTETDGKLSALMNEWDISKEEMDELMDDPESHFASAKERLGVASDAYAVKVKASFQSEIDAAKVRLGEDPEWVEAGKMDPKDGLGDDHPMQQALTQLQEFGVSMKHEVRGDAEDADSHYLICELPGHFAAGICMAIELGLAAIHEQRPLPMFRPDKEVTLNAAIAGLADGDPKVAFASLGMSQAMVAMMADTMAKEPTETHETLDFDWAERMETQRDAVWIKAIEDGGGPVERPHDLTNFLKHLNKRNEELEAKVRELEAKS